MGPGGCPGAGSRSQLPRELLLVDGVALACPEENTPGRGGLREGGLSWGPDGTSAEQKGLGINSLQHMPGEGQACVPIASSSDRLVLADGRGDSKASRAGAALLDLSRGREAGRWVSPAGQKVNGGP